jgi:hypothetical protein
VSKPFWKHTRYPFLVCSRPSRIEWWRSMELTNVFFAPCTGSLPRTIASSTLPTSTLRADEVAQGTSTPPPKRTKPGGPPTALALTAGCEH